MNKESEEIKIFLSKTNLPGADDVIDRIQEVFTGFQIKIYVCENFPQEVEKYEILATPTIVIGDAKLVGFGNLDRLIERIHEHIKLQELKHNIVSLSRRILIDRLLIRSHI